MEKVYTSSTKIYALEQIQAYNKQKRLDFNLDCQRGYVWTDAQKQALIDTLVFQERIPEVHAIKEDTSPIFHIADGKQRLSTILSFLNNELAWKKSQADTSFRYLFGKKDKLYFSELPIELQNTILSIEIPFATYKNMTPKGTIKLFRKLNSGSQLSEFQKGIASNAILRTNFSNKLLKHKAISNIFSEKMINKDKTEECLIDLLCFMLAAEENNEITAVSIDSKDIFNYKKSYLKEGLTLTDTNLEEWLNTLSEKSCIIEYYLDIFYQKMPADTCKIRNKVQFIFPVLFAWFYNLDEDEFLNLFSKMSFLKVTDVVGAGANYTRSVMQKWLDYIENNLL